MLNISLFVFLQKHLAADDSGWPQGMLDHIRNSDETVLKGCDKARFLFCYRIICCYFSFVRVLMSCFALQILSFYQTDLLPSESFSELFDVAGT